MLSVHDVKVVFGGQTILDGVSFTAKDGQRIGLVGPNGSGKSTLLKVVHGDLEASHGDITATGHVAYVPQDFGIDQSLCVLDYVKRQLGLYELEQVIAEAESAYARGEEPADLQGYLDSMEEFRALGGYDLEVQVKRVIATVALPERVLSMKMGELSGGQQVKVGLMAVLISRYDIYLLDEPTNNLDLEGIQLLEEFIVGSTATFVIVSHDRKFLDRTIQGIVELDEFTHQAEFYGVNFSEYRRIKALNVEGQVRRYAENVEERQRLEQSASRLSGQASSSGGRRSDNDKLNNNYRGARATSSSSRSSRAIRSRLDQLEAVSKPFEGWDLHISLHAAARSGEMVARLDGCSVELGSFKFGPASQTIVFQDRIAIIGSNGSGKSTFLKLLTGDLKPTGGTVSLGSGVVVGRIDQDHRLLVQEQSVLENAIKLTNLDVESVRSLLAKFNLGAESVDRSVATLSPGERSRLLLAILMANGSNVLLLDEPTNHLDLKAQEELEQALQTYDGTLLVVSHDREFLSNLHCNRVLSIESGQMAEIPIERSFIESA